MKLTKAILNAAKVYNSYDIAKMGCGKVVLSYHAYVARSCDCAKWVVNGVGFNTNPKAAWYDNGCQTFPGNMRSTALDEAKAWAGAQYAISEWERDPFGDWQDKRVMDAVRNKLKPAAVKA